MGRKKNSDIVVEVFTGSGSWYGDREIDRDMGRLDNLKKAYDTAESKEMKDLYERKWYALIEHIAKRLELRKINDDSVH